MKRHYQFVVERTYVTTLDIHADSREEAKAIYDEMVDNHELYEAEMEQCNVEIDTTDKPRITCLINVRSSYGNLTVNGKTGKVICCYGDEDNPDNYIQHIDRVDLIEYKKYWGHEPFEDEDILNFDYWNKDGTKDFHEAGWREETKLLMAGEKL